MLSRIYSYLIDKGKLGENLATALIMIVFLERILIAVALGLFLGYWAAYPFFGGRYKGDGAIVGLLIFLFRFFSVGKKWPLKFLSLEGVLDSLFDESDDEPKVKAERFGKLPHFGKLLDKKKTMDAISMSEFSPYKTKDGESLEHILVSDDEKWLCIFGGYMPVDLICGYSFEKNELYSIDGAVIKLPLRARRLSITREINDFFKDRGMVYYKRPWKANEKFMTAFKKPYSEFSKADFSRLRYQWEKENAKDIVCCMNNGKSWGEFDPAKDDGADDTAIFERVLSDMEISNTVIAVSSHEVKISDYMNFDAYKNEFCVCNGVELLSRLGASYRPEGLDFLFECLADVDEAYFVPAVNLLCKYQKRLVREKIEIEIRRAFENEDVMRIGGIMYLADRLDYKIQFFEEMKKAGDSNAQEKLEVAGMPF